jgi:hypothetical protein
MKTFHSWNPELLRLEDSLDKREEVTYYMAKPPNTVYKATPGP